MSEAAEAIRAIDAIDMTLAERMTLALRDVPDVRIPGLRKLAYHKAGVMVDDYAPDEWENADLQAFSSELMRRFNP